MTDLPTAVAVQGRLMWPFSNRHITLASTFALRLETWTTLNHQTMSICIEEDIDMKCAGRELDLQSFSFTLPIRISQAYFARIGIGWFGTKMELTDQNIPRGKATEQKIVFSRKRGYRFGA